MAASASACINVIRVVFTDSLVSSGHAFIVFSQMLSVLRRGKLSGVNHHYTRTTGGGLVFFS